MTAQQSTRYSYLRDQQVLDHLLSIADSKGRLSCSTYAISCELGLHRQTLSRILLRLARTGCVTLADHSCTPIHVTKDVPLQTPDVTHPVTNSVTNFVTNFVTYTIVPLSPYATTLSVPLPTENVTLFVTDSVTNTMTSTVTDKKETKQKNEEVPPAPLQEDKKQNKEKNTPSHPRACEKKSTKSKKSNEERLVQRRQRFVDSLQPFATRYGQEMLNQFADYWTEPNHSNTKMRFELQRTWSTALLLARCARNDDTFYQPSSNDNHHDCHNLHNNPYHRPTSADYIREAQQWAIERSIQTINSPQNHEEPLSLFPF